MRLNYKSSTNSKFSSKSVESLPTLCYKHQSVKSKKPFAKKRLRLKRKISKGSDGMGNSSTAIEGGNCLVSSARLTLFA